MTTTSPSVPPPRAVPAFEPLRVRGARRGPCGPRGVPGLRVLRGRRRAPAALLALAATALAIAAWDTGPVAAWGEGRTAAPGHERPARARPPAAARLVSAPVRIADAATVRLLRPGDRVDVIAAPHASLGGTGEARVVATGARVADVPRSGATPADGGALIVLSVPRSTATVLAGAGVTSQLAVTVC